jgi:hypothetical protein
MRESSDRIPQCEQGHLQLLHIYSEMIGWIRLRNVGCNIWLTDTDAGVLRVSILVTMRAVTITSSAFEEE